MSAYSIVTWNEATQKTKRQVSNATTFDFQQINIGADALPISDVGGQFSFGSKVLGNAGTPVVSTDLTTKGYVDSAIATAVISGGTVKQSVLTAGQLSSSNGISAAAIFYLTAVAGAGDTFILKNSSGTETYTFSASAGVFTPATGANAGASMSSLAARINTDSAYWSAIYEAPNLAEVNSGGGSIVIYEKTTASGASSSRVYGVFAAPSTAKVVSFNSLYEYNITLAIASHVITMPSTDPSGTQFGFRTTLSNLVAGEIHYVQDTDVLSSWDASASVWYTLASGVIPSATSGAGGGIQGKLTADSNFGLSIAAGVLKVQTDSASLGFSSGNLTVILDGSTLSKSGSGLKVAAGGITNTEINSSALGNGLTGGSGTALSVVPGDGISVSGAGVAANYNAAMTNDNGSAITAGQIVYESAAGHVNLASASVSNLYNLPIYVVTAASIGAGSAGNVAVRPGCVVTGLTGLTPGPVFVSGTAGAVTQNVSGFTTGQCAYQVGYSINATSFVYDPVAIIEY